VGAFLPFNLPGSFGWKTPYCDPACLQDGTESTLLKNLLSIHSIEIFSKFAKDILNRIQTKSMPTDRCIATGHLH
jgi:hypothetical protein